MFAVRYFAARMMALANLKTPSLERTQGEERRKSRAGRTTSGTMDIRNSWRETTDAKSDGIEVSLQILPTIEVFEGTFDNGFGAGERRFGGKDGLGKADVEEGRR
jgi:hypothetical protein